MKTKPGHILIQHETNRPSHATLSGRPCIVAYRVTSCIDSVFRCLTYKLLCALSHCTTSRISPMYSSALVYNNPAYSIEGPSTPEPCRQHPASAFSPDHRISNHLTSTLSESNLRLRVCRLAGWRRGPRAAALVPNRELNIVYPNCNT